MRIPVVMTCDRNVFFAAGTAIESMAENAASGTFYEVSIFCAGDVTAEDRGKMSQIAARHADVLSVGFLDMGDQLSGIRFNHPYLNHVAAYRLLIPEKLPQHDRVLYLDVDIIVRKDLSALFSCDLGGAYLGGVCSMVCQMKGRAGISRISGISDMDWYVNAGVLLLDTARMRADGIGRRCISLLERFADGLADQDDINYVCNGRIAFLPPEFNVCLSSLDFYIDGKAHAFASPGECRAAYEDPAIFHFSRKTKPWDYYDLPFAHEWFRYFAKTPFYAPRERRALCPQQPSETRTRPGPRGFAKLGYRLWSHLNKRFGNLV